MAPVSVNDPAPLFLLLLKLGRPALCPKKLLNATSRSLNASCGAHFDTSYNHDSLVFLSLLSSLWRSTAVGVFSFGCGSRLNTRMLLFHSSPQLYANLAAPACLYRAASWASSGASSVL